VRRALLLKRPGPAANRSAANALWAVFITRHCAGKCGELRGVILMGAASGRTIEGHRTQLLTVSDDHNGKMENAQSVRRKKEAGRAITDSD